MYIVVTHISTVWQSCSQQIPGRLSHLQGCIHKQAGRKVTILPQFNQGYCSWNTVEECVPQHFSSVYIHWKSTRKSFRPRQLFRSTTWFWPSAPFFVIWLSVIRRQHSTRIRQQAAVRWKFSPPALHCSEVSRAKVTAKTLNL